MNTARELTENLASLLRREHGALAEFLVALADFDKRRVWVQLGHSSLFYFLHRELRLSKSAAQYRKVAAELIQEIPGIVEPLRRGDLCLSSIIEAAKVVTAENWEKVLPRFYGLSRREAMEVAADLQPHPAPPVRTVVTPVRSVSVSPTDFSRKGLAVVGNLELRPPAPSGVDLEATSLEVSSPAEPDCSTLTPSAPSVTPAPSTPAPSLDMVPLTAELSRIHLTVSKEFMRKLETARDALSHAMPGATPAEILEAGLDLLLVQAAKRRGLVEKAQKNVRPSRGDGIPAHVKREVWKRDGGRCQWPVSSGGICGSTRHLEVDHVHPRSTGGASTTDNLRILCRAHNDLAARLVLGDDTMDRYTHGLSRASAGRAGKRVVGPRPASWLE